MLPPAKTEPTPMQSGQTTPSFRPARPADAQTINSGLFPGLTAGVPPETNLPQQGNTAQNQSLAASGDKMPRRGVPGQPGRLQRSL